MAIHKKTSIVYPEPLDEAMEIISKEEQRSKNSLIVKAMETFVRSHELVKKSKELRAKLSAYEEVQPKGRHPR